MKVENGQLAPGFVAQNYTGETIDLEQYRGKKVWLGFYRWASCPTCNYRMHEVLQRYEEFAAKGIQLVAVFQSPAENIEKHIGEQKPPFPLIADPDLELYDKYGVHARASAMFHPRVFIAIFKALFGGFFTLAGMKSDGPKAMVPADFLVDPEGLVWRAHYGDAISDHIPLQQIDEFADDQCLEMPADAVA